MSKHDLIAQLQSQIEELESAPLMNGTAKAERGRKAEKRPKGEVDLTSASDAFKKVTALVNASDKSEKSIRERLEQADFTPDAIDEAVSRAKSYGFIDDSRYAAVLIRSRIAQSKGISGIERELKGHGIDIERVPGWPEEFEVDESTELERALALLNRRPPRSKNLREGAYRKLINKGFSSPIASSAARMWAEGIDTAF